MRHKQRILVRQHKKSSGFTLIELLVVIAIIGILSAVVLASLNSARVKGSDAAVQSNMTGAETQAEVDYSNSSPNAGGGSCYTYPSAGTCLIGGFPIGACPTTAQASTIFAHATILNQIARAKSAGRGLNACIITSNDAAYAIISQLKSDPALAWCVDSTPASKQEGTAGGTALTQATIQSLIASGQCN